MLNLQNTNNPHDTFCKKIFEHPDLALAFILDHIPELRDQIIGPPEVISGTLIDNETRRVLYCDCVWKLKLKPKPDKPTHTYIILEHKSSPDSKVGIQLSKYTSTFAERLANEDSNTVQQSPEIIPMVLYHGKGKWDLPEVYKTSSNRGEKAWGTTTHLIYINLSTLPRDKLSSNPSLHAAFYTMLFSTGALGKGDKAPPMEKVIKMIFKNSSIRNIVMDYLADTHKDRGDEIMTILEKMNLTEGDKIMSNNIANRWITEGIAQGIAQGKAEGIAEGEVVILTQLLQRKFGQLPKNIQQRLTQATPDDLEAWADKILDAPSLDAIFGERPRH